MTDERWTTLAIKARIAFFAENSHHAGVASPWEKTHHTSRAVWLERVKEAFFYTGKGDWLPSDYVGTGRSVWMWSAFFDCVKGESRITQTELFGAET